MRFVRKKTRKKINKGVIKTARDGGVDERKHFCPRAFELKNEIFHSKPSRFPFHYFNSFQIFVHFL